MVHSRILSFCTSNCLLLQNLIFFCDILVHNFTTKHNNRVITNLLSANRVLPCFFSYSTAIIKNIQSQYPIESHGCWSLLENQLNGTESCKPSTNIGIRPKLDGISSTGSPTHQEPAYVHVRPCSRTATEEQNIFFFFYSNFSEKYFWA